METIFANALACVDHYCAYDTNFTRRDAIAMSFPRPIESFRNGVRPKDILMAGTSYDNRYKKLLYSGLDDELILFALLNNFLW